MSTLSDEHWKKIATPALFARTVGRFKMAPHLIRISQALVRASSVGGARIVLSVPPRHGKSYLVSHHFPAWYLGFYPDRRIILASYEADFAAGWGRKARLLLEQHGSIFGVKVSADSSAANRWDIEGREGGMVTAGVGGAITGKGADLLLIDDPVKNYQDAHSETLRETAKNWLTSTAYTRLEPNGSVIIIMTRWHADDLAGWVLRELTHENWEELRFPAIAEENDVLGRKPGEALWPARYNAERLRKTEKTLGPYQWSSLYQQRPTPDEGGMFKRAWFTQFIDRDAVPKEARFCRYWDKAGTTNGGDYSVGILMAWHDDIFYVVDEVRGQWSAHTRNKIIEQTAELDSATTKKYEIGIEQEGGSGGKESAEFSVKQLAGYTVHAERVTGTKEDRARPFSSQCEGGNVKLVRDGSNKRWNREYIEEHCVFPNGTHDDRIDASSGAFNRLALHRKRRAYVI